MRRLALGLVAGVAALFVLSQAVPYGRDRANPRVRQEPSWDLPRARALVIRACYGCDSNEAVLPWYSAIAPASWVIQRDVAEARRKLNVSEWERMQREAWESAKTVRNGDMPPWSYAVLHPEARLSRADRQALAQGFDATFGVRRPRGGGGRSHPGESD